jgi:hypothetical protein
MAVRITDAIKEGILCIRFDNGERAAAASVIDKQTDAIFAPGQPVAASDRFLVGSKRSAAKAAAAFFIWHRIFRARRRDLSDVLCQDAK